MTETQENLAEMFFSKLKVSTNPGVILAQFYGALTGKEVGRSEIIMMNKLVKIYGRASVFFSTIDVSRLKDLTEFPYAYLFTVCRAKFQKASEADLSINSMISLERRIASFEEEIAKVKRIDPEKASKYLEGK
jgi:uncharacterized small protein (DUF1192 family)